MKRTNFLRFINDFLVFREFCWSRTLCFLLIFLLITSFFCLAISAQKKSKSRPATNSSKASEASLKETARRAPHNFLANHNLGEYYLQTGKLWQALPWLEAAASIDPSHFNNQYDLILAYVSIGKLAAANTNIQALMAKNNSADAHNLLGVVEAALGHQQAAAEAYQRAAQLDPSEKNIFDYGESILKLNAAEEALKIFNFGVQKFPKSAQLRVGEAISQYGLGKFKEAIATLCEAVDLNPKDERAYIFLGEMYGISVELSDEINQRFAKFIQLQPRNALAHYYYAMNLWKGKHNESAQADVIKIESLLKTATTLDPKLTDAFYNLGLLYFEQQKLNLAITQLRSAVVLKPQVSIIHFKLAQAYQRTGQNALAAQEFEATKKYKALEFEAVKKTK